MGRLGNLKSAIRGRAANWCMRNCQSRVEPAKRVPTDGLHRASSRTYDHPTGVLLPLLYKRTCRYGRAHTMILRQFDLGAELRSHYSADSLPPARVVLAHRERSRDNKSTLTQSACIHNHPGPISPHLTMRTHAMLPRYRVRGLNVPFVQLEKRKRQNWWLGRLCQRAMSSLPF